MDRWHSLENILEEREREENAGAITGIVDRTWVEERLRGRNAPASAEEHYVVAPERLSRNEKIVWYRSHGWDLKEIAEMFGISRQRAHQICKRDAIRKEVIPE